MKQIKWMPLLLGLVVGVASFFVCESLLHNETTIEGKLFKVLKIALIAFAFSGFVLLVLKKWFPEVYRKIAHDFNRG